MSLRSSTILLLTLCLFAERGSAQCLAGPPPNPRTINTAFSGLGTRLPTGVADLHWTWTIDDINGVYAPAIVMDSLPKSYYRTIWPDCYWISSNVSGMQTGNKDFFYKIDFDLPCTNPCGLSYDLDGVYCLGLDIYADNSVTEIYVNGVAQSPSLGGRIPYTNPYQADGASLAGGLTVRLCSGWKAGRNSLVVKVASSAPMNGILVQASQYIDPNITQYITAWTCETQGYDFAGKHLTASGKYYDTLHHAPGCDSIIKLALLVKTVPHSYDTVSICAGSAYNGYTRSGIYSDTIPVPGECDSLHTLVLYVNPPPHPDLGATTQLCTGTTLTLSPGKYDTYQWQDGSALDHFNVTRAGLYSVVVTDSCGSGSASVNITETSCGIYFPNAFSPNGDGLNDTFHILTGFTLQDFHLEIHDRWGKRVFVTNDQHRGWNGQSNGAIIIGTYAWSCSYVDQGKKVVRKGTVEVVR